MLLSCLQEHKSGTLTMSGGAYAVAMANFISYMMFSCYYGRDENEAYLNDRIYVISLPMVICIGLLHQSWQPCKCAQNVALSNVHVPASTIHLKNRKRIAHATLTLTLHIEVVQIATAGEPMM